MVYFAIKCVKTGVVINAQQNISTRRDTLIDGATGREGQKDLTVSHVYRASGIRS